MTNTKIIAEITGIVALAYITEGISSPSINVNSITESNEYSDTGEWTYYTLTVDGKEHYCNEGFELIEDLLTDVRNDYALTQDWDLSDYLACY